MLDEGGEGCEKAEKTNHCASLSSHSFSHLLSKAVAVDYTAVLFIYTFCFVEHNLINWTGSLATVDSHCFYHTIFLNDVYRHVPN